MVPTTLRRGLGPRAALCASLVLATLVAGACNDITAPNRQTPVPATLRLNPMGTVIVAPDSMHGWAFYNDQQGVACGDTLMCRMVLGPKLPPAGTGSAELATNAAAEGNALVLPDYGGTRFDQITELRYSTYRRSVDAGRNLAIALQMNVDYDLDDQANGYQGRIVFEPYQSSGGNVPDTTWQAWDTRAGNWWGTRTTVTANGVSIGNPCVQSSPCTWTTLLATFPNLGVHRTYGAVILKAGSGWPSFRGNADLLTISVGGIATTFDFEPTPRSAVGFHLRVVADDGVTSAHPLSRDTVLPPGAVVSYSFGTATGASSLLIVLDDTLAAATGTFVMDRDRTVYAETEPDTPIETSATVADLGQRVRALMLSTMPEQALADFMTWYDAQATVVGEDMLAAQLDTARYLSIDGVADSAAIRKFNETVNGTEFIFESEGPVWYMKPEWYGYEPNSDGRATASRSSTLRTSSLTARRAARMRQMNPAMRALDVSPDPEPGDPEPDERMAIMYVNGIYAPLVPLPGGDGSSAATTARALANLARNTQRFGRVGRLRKNITVSLVYNNSISQTVRDWEAAHACDVKYLAKYRFMKPVHALWFLSVCKAVPFSMNTLASDIGQAIYQILQLMEGSSGFGTKDVQKVLYDVLGHHQALEHTLLVGHSQGNLIITQALQDLPAIEGKALNVNNNCTAVLALASPLAKSSFPVEPQYRRGLIAEGDILLQIGLPNNFPRIHTPAGDSVLLMGNLWPRALQGVNAHYVDANYLRTETSRQAVAAELTALSDECLVGAFTLAPQAMSIPVQDKKRLDVSIRSRTGRNLEGRWFTGRSSHAFVTGEDSTVTGMMINASAPVTVRLYNTNKMPVTLSVGVEKLQLNIVAKWSEEGIGWERISGSFDYLPGQEPTPCGSLLRGVPPDESLYRAWCRLTYTFTATRVDGKTVTFLDARPLDPKMGDPSRTYLGNGEPLQTAIETLLFITGETPVTQFEVRTVNGQIVDSSPIAIDTVTATFDHKIPWPYASSNSIDAIFAPSSMPVAAPNARVATADRLRRPVLPAADVRPSVTANAVRVDHRSPATAR